MEQRIIKFRAWDKSRNRMIVVPTIHFGDDGSALTVTVRDKTIEGFDNMYVVGESCELMQFTGLLDKNGKEIYEGDIVEGTWNKTSVRGPVDFQQGMFGVTDLDEYSLNRLVVEVIGNIWENPDLLSPSSQGDTK